MTSTKDKGAEVETLALNFLINNGFKLVDRNYTCRYGEIDLIVKNKQVLVFVEVRYRKNTAFGTPLETVTKQKQKRIIIAAQHYLQSHKHQGACRFDVIGVTSHNERFEFNWVKAAFES